MNYYFIYGPQMEDVVTSYTDLTGKPELPPLWALGYHQCKWSYYQKVM
jgi:alpha-glucosidase